MRILHHLSTFLMVGWLFVLSIGRIASLTVGWLFVRQPSPLTYRVTKLCKDEVHFLLAICTQLTCTYIYICIHA